MHGRAIERLLSFESTKHGLVKSPRVVEILPRRLPRHRAKIRKRERPNLSLGIHPGALGRVRACKPLRAARLVQPGIVGAIFAAEVHHPFLPMGFGGAGGARSRRAVDELVVVFVVVKGRGDGGIGPSHGGDGEGGGGADPPSRRRPEERAVVRKLVGRHEPRGGAGEGGGCSRLAMAAEWLGQRRTRPVPSCCGGRLNPCYGSGGGYHD
mmetsp:Transcript_29599/g.87738  ORF Transcript_29599/g.87738 Transcript_29599/m.87738 type:complete len:210 (+) Transcript_29599:2363-2992(+)